MGNLGLATSFFNDKNRNLVKDLVELIVESNQELPSWLEAMSLENRGFQSNRRGGKGGRFGGTGFGGKDYRFENGGRGGGGRGGAGGGRGGGGYGGGGGGGWGTSGSGGGGGSNWSGPAAARSKFSKKNSHVLFSFQDFSAKIKPGCFFYLQFILDNYGGSYGGGGGGNVDWWDS